MNYNFKRLVITRLITENLFLLLLQFTGMIFSVFSSQPLPVDFAAGHGGGIHLHAWLHYLTRNMVGYIFSSLCFWFIVHALQFTRLRLHTTNGLIILVMSVLYQSRLNFY